MSSEDIKFPDEGGFERIIDDPESYESVEEAIKVLVAIEDTVEEEDLHKSTMVIRTDILYGIVNTLLIYAECVDELDVDSLIEQHQVDNEMFGRQTPMSYTLH